MKRHDLINSFIDNIDKNYLEIGVQRGITFVQIKCNNKDSVDPYPILEGINRVNFKTTSDDFFETKIQKKYDYIFIDGLHECHQALKDFKNSYNNLNKNGIIFFDDVLPQNKNEQIIPVSSVTGPCTGDIWKLIYHILIHKGTFDISYISSFVNMNSECRGMFVMKFNTLDNNNFFENIGDISSYYNYEKDFNKYKELLFNLKGD
jgi:hypothetical protein